MKTDDGWDGGHMGSLLFLFEDTFETALENATTIQRILAAQHKVPMIVIVSLNNYYRGADSGRFHDEAVAAVAALRAAGVIVLTYTTTRQGHLPGGGFKPEPQPCCDSPAWIREHVRAQLGNFTVDGIFFVSQRTILAFSFRILHCSADILPSAFLYSCRTMSRTTRARPTRPCSAAIITTTTRTSSGTCAASATTA
jgi:hypothetical protein